MTREFHTDLELADHERKVRMVAQAEELLRQSLAKLHTAQLKTMDWNRLMEQMQSCLQGMRVLPR